MKQRQQGDGPLVTSQERRVACVPRINLWSTAGQPVIVYPAFGLNGISIVRASEGSFRTAVYDALGTLGGKGDGCLLGKPTRRRPVLPGPAPHRRPAVHHPAPTRPWNVRVLGSTSQGTRRAVDERFVCGTQCALCPWMLLVDRLAVACPRLWIIRV